MDRILYTAFFTAELDQPGRESLTGRQFGLTILHESAEGHPLIDGEEIVEIVGEAVCQLELVKLRPGVYRTAQEIPRGAIRRFEGATSAAL